MAQFVQEYAALRWSAIVAFLIAAALILTRLATAREAPRGSSVSERAAVVGDPVVGSVSERVAVVGDRAVGYHESDAAHLVMCLVMLAMLVFPAAFSPDAVRGVLTAMVVVFAGLLVSRVVQWRVDAQTMPGDRLVPLGYHTATAAAMLYAMSGHSPTGHTGGPAVLPALIIAGFFAADALFVTLAGATGRLAVDTPGGLGIARCAGGCVVAWTGPPRRAAMVPHVVMELGTAYMLVAAVSN